MMLNTLFCCSITIHSLDYGESSLTSVPEGLVLSVHGAGASFSTNWTIEEEDWYVHRHAQH